MARIDRKTRSIQRRLERYGLRVVCASCLNHGRHRPSAGRLRDARCSSCGARALKSLHWIGQNEGRWQMKCHELAAVGRGSLR